MKRTLGLLVLMMVGLFAACQNSPQPIEYLIEVTRVVTVVVTPEGGCNCADAQAVDADDTSAITPTIAITPVNNADGDTTVVAETTPEVSPTPDPFPTPEIAEVFVAQQPFQNGQMFWIRPIDQIWVITTNAEGEQTWQVYQDTFEDGMQESDPEFTPPISGLYQPVRGFGKLWRETDTLREQLGYGVAQEVGYLGIYEYHYGGTVENGEFEQSSGYHILRAIDGTTYRFNEGTWTWEIVETDDDEQSTPVGN